MLEDLVTLSVFQVIRDVPTDFSQPKAQGVKPKVTKAFSRL